MDKLREEFEKGFMGDLSINTHTKQKDSDGLPFYSDRFTRIAWIHFCQGARAIKALADEIPAVAYQCSIYRTYFDNGSRWEAGIYPADFVEACSPSNVKDKIALIKKPE